MGGVSGKYPDEIKEVWLVMKIDNTNIMVCDCGGTMTIDGKALAKACQATGSTDVATSLCRNQTDRLAKSMQAAATNNESLIVACTQETDVFAEIADEIGVEIPGVVNIREMAGWSDQGNKATAKMAARGFDCAGHDNARPTLWHHIVSGVGNKNGNTQCSIKFGAKIKRGINACGA